MSDFVKTVQRQATGAGVSLESPSRIKAPSSASSCPWSPSAADVAAAFSRSACWSMKDPVPEAHGPFIAKCSSRQRSPCQSSAKSAASCPPIAMMVRTPGATCAAPRICATVSGSQGTPRRAASACPCDPVKVTEPSAAGPSFSRTESSAARTAAAGRPKCRLYGSAWTIRPVASSTAQLTLTEPASRPTAKRAGRGGGGGVGRTARRDSIRVQ